MINFAKTYLCKKNASLKPFFVETLVRWSDLDANRHLANASYMNFTSFARMGFIRHLGVTMHDLAHWNIGPAVLREEFSFFKEAYDNQEIIITVELTGMSEFGEIFEFTHNLYLKNNGTHLAFSKVFGVWFGMNDRKISPLPEDFLKKFKDKFNPSDLKTLSLADIKSLPVKPQNIDISQII